MVNSPSNDLLACLVLNGLFKSLKYGEAYLTPYLITKSLSEEQVNNKIYPIWTYSYLAFMIPFSLTSDWLGAWTLLLVEGIMEVVTYGLLTWGQSLWMMQTMQVTFGLASASNFGYYMIVKQLFSSEKKEKEWNAYLRSIALMGHVIASLAAQGTLFMEWASYQSLFVGSFIMVVLGTIFVVPLKRISSTGLVAKKELSKDSDEAPSKKLSLLNSLRMKIKTCYGKAEILLLTLLWSITFGTLMIGESYCTSYWYEIRIINDSDYDMNGIMDAVGRGSGALAALAVSFLPNSVYRVKYFTSLLVIFIVLNSGACFFLTQWMKNIPAACIAWTLYIGTGYFTITFISGQLTSLATDDQIGFMMGCQLFVSVCFQTLLQLIESESVLNLSLSSRYFSLFIISGASLIILPFLYSSHHTLAKKDEYSSEI